MPFADWFRKKKVSRCSSAGVADEIMEALSATSMKEEIGEVKNILDDVLGYLRFKVASERELVKSASADLECVGPRAYNVHLNVEFIDSKGNIFQPALNFAASLSAQYITVSLIAQKHGRSEYALQPGERIGLGDLVDTAHPLHKVLPGLVPISVPRE